MENRSKIFVSLLLLPLLLTTISAQSTKLTPNFYKTTCPNVESIVRSAVQQKFRQTFVTAPATLRLFFHDCFVRVSEFMTLFVDHNCMHNSCYCDWWSWREMWLCIYRDVMLRYCLRVMVMRRRIIRMIPP